MYFSARASLSIGLSLWQITNKPYLSGTISVSVLAMTNIQFSFADLALVITIVECVLTFCLIVIARAMPAPSKTCRIALGALFLAIAADALAMLMIWHVGIREAYSAHSSVPLLLASLALGSKGPLLYWFIRTLTQPNYRLKRRHLWHALPAGTAALAVALYHLNVVNVTLPIESDHGTPGAFLWWTLMRATPVIYAIASMIRLRTMNALYDSHYTGNEYHYSYWIKLLITGFFIQWGLGLLTHIAGQYLPTGAAALLGKTNDVLGLVLVNGLLLYSFTLLRTLMPILGSDDREHQNTDAPDSQCDNAPTLCAACSAPVIEDNHTINDTTVDQTPTVVSGIQEAGDAEIQQTYDTCNHSEIQGDQHTATYQPTVQNQPEDPNEQQALILIASGISEKQLHLIHTLNIEKFARAINHPTKEVSRLINTHYGCSFSEFINAYRTMEAERLLKAPEHQNTPVVEIISLSGFNSKSAFHRFFKRFTQHSPSEYRAMLAAENRIRQEASV